MDFTNTHLRMAEFQWSNKAFALGLWVCISVICLLLYQLGFTGNSLIVGTLAYLVIGYTAVWFWARRWHELTLRIAAVDSELWQVEVNGVRVGEISDAEYARIARSIVFDFGTYASEMIRFTADIYRILLNFAFKVPAIAFWVAVVFWLDSPTEFASALDSIKALSTSDLNASTPQLITIIAIFMIFYVCVHAALSVGSIRETKFGSQIAAGILKSIGCPATGPMTLSRYNPSQRELFVNLIS